MRIFQAGDKDAFLKYLTEKIGHESSFPSTQEEREQRRLQAFFDSDWGPIFEEQQAQAEAEREAAERNRRGGFWCG